MADELFIELNRFAVSASVPANKVLFRRGEVSDSVYLVRRGFVALLWPNTEDLTPMEMLGPGSVLGLPAAMNGSYTISGTAVVDC